MSEWCVLEGDCLDILKDCPDAYFDAMVTDPPAGVKFMGREWDSDKGGRDQWIAWLQSVMVEVKRTLKPGAHCLVWALPRTSHWAATAIEDAGFEVRDVVTHHFGSGFPKSQDVGKFIDKLAGAEREVVGVSRSKGIRPGSHNIVGDVWEQKGHELTAPATQEAKAWDGWGTALKPATEHWILARKPLSESSIARNVLAHGVGALNIDACRVPGLPESTRFDPDKHSHDGWRMNASGDETAETALRKDGRWPPNLVLTHSEGCEKVGTRRMFVGGSGKFGGKDFSEFTDPEAEMRQVKGKLYRDDDYKETVEVWECAAGCPVAELDRQSGFSKSPLKTVQGGKNGGGFDVGSSDGTRHRLVPCYGDSGGASRFFPTFRYQAKPSRGEKEAGLNELPNVTFNRVNPGGLEHEERWKPVQVKNNHPTVKGIELCRWLCRLITPPGGRVLDPFAGSGSIGAAALLEGFNYVGIEQDPDYCEIARGRLQHWANNQ